MDSIFPNKNNERNFAVLDPTGQCCLFWGSLPAITKLEDIFSSEEKDTWGVYTES